MLPAISAWTESQSSRLWPKALVEQVLDTMRFNVAQLLKSPAGASREYVLDEDIAGIDPDLDALAPITGKVRLVRTNDGILVTGHIRTVVRVPCRRCLMPASAPVEVNLEEVFHPSIDIITGAALPLADDEEEATRTDAHHILDLTEVMRQELLLAVPMTAVCSRDCKGLCPNCGANLNESPCGCQPEEVDPRLAALRSLL
jgi:uncharacterized protein